MSAPVSVRLGEETRRKIARIARRRRVSPATIMRQAIEQAVQLEEHQSSPYELIKDVIGVARGGDPHLSERTGRRFAEMLRKRRRGR